MLPRADAAVERVSGESRDGWRRRKNATTGFGATLVAARLDKPVPFSGWKLDVAQSGNFGACPKPTVLAVPAGSCYVFECETEDEALDLAKDMQAIRKVSIHEMTECLSNLKLAERIPEKSISSILRMGAEKDHRQPCGNEGLDR